MSILVIGLVNDLNKYLKASLNIVRSLALDKFIDNWSRINFIVMNAKDYPFP